MRIDKNSWHYKLYSFISSEIQPQPTKCKYVFTLSFVIIFGLSFSYFALALLGSIFYIATFYQLGWIIPSILASPGTLAGLLFSIFPLLIGYYSVILYLKINKNCNKIEFKD